VREIACFNDSIVTGALTRIIRVAVHVTRRGGGCWQFRLVRRRAEFSAAAHPGFGG